MHDENTKIKTIFVIKGCDKSYLLVSDTTTINPKAINVHSIKIIVQIFLFIAFISPIVNV